MGESGKQRGGAAGGGGGSGDGRTYHGDHGGDFGPVGGVDAGNRE